ncbi:MAG: class I SAM-dependent methyltransferase [Natrialbaceae archaeon]|nr:class I SAM-dependent methyltransferase [Natrialbaceae archaeon]
MADHDIAHPLVASVYDYAVPDRVFGPHRAWLLEGLSGRVLEIGAGTGANFPYVDGEDIEYHAIEPDPHMRSRAVETATETGLAVDLHDSRAESLPFDDGSFDAVVAGLVFCTIEDPDTALDEVVRVLRSGGEFRFLEHVHGSGITGVGQDFIEPLWSRLAGGCRLTRDSVEHFVAHESLEVLEIERVGAGIFPASPVVRGRLRKR